MLLAGLQGMAVDITCMLLWHTHPFEHDADEVRDHHPDSPDNHQEGADIADLFGEFGTMLLDHTDFPTLDTLLPLPQYEVKAHLETALYLLNPSLIREDDPPKHTTT